jgi:hypothetical protein
MYPSIAGIIYIIFNTAEGKGVSDRVL